MQFGFPLKEKIAFYWRYFISKVFCLWFEVKMPKFKMFIYEMLYSLSKFGNRNALPPSPFKTDLVETKFGRFRIRSGTVDMSNVSPAFERRDMDYLLRLIKRLKNEGKKILFLDIGADLGTYCVTVGNMFKDYKDIHIMAFEPAKSSYDLLMENIDLNSLREKVRAYNLALYSEDNRELEFLFNVSAPGVSGLKVSGASDIKAQKVITKTLDFVIASFGDYDSVIFKIDVEGVETEVLKGAGVALNSGKEIYLLVEDFVNPEIIDYLKKRGAGFITKLTPYNSWWGL